MIDDNNKLLVLDDKRMLFFIDNNTYKYDNMEFLHGTGVIEITTAILFDNIRIDENSTYNILCSNRFYIGVKCSNIIYTEELKHLTLFYEDAYSLDSAEYRKFKIRNLLK